MAVVCEKYRGIDCQNYLKNLKLTPPYPFVPTKKEKPKSENFFFQFLKIPRLLLFSGIIVIYFVNG